MINTQNIGDNECFKWCLVRYLHHADHYPARIIKAEKNFSGELDLTDITFSAEIKDTLHRVRKHFCSYCLQAFITEKNIQTSY